MPLFLALLPHLLLGTEPTPGHPLRLPTVYDGGRFFVAPVAQNGKRLRLYTDSAGGFFFVQEALEEAGGKRVGEEQGRGIYSLPEFRKEAWVPAPMGVSSVGAGKRAEMPGFAREWDGLLGVQWFGGRTWTFDYQRRELLLRAPGDLPKHRPEDEFRLAYKDSKASPQVGFGRVTVSVDGQAIDFLFDTGAMDVLPEDVLREVGDGGPARRATSFLAQSQYEAWKTKHPEWRRIEKKTENGSAMIEVPKVKVGGHEVGPVWFSVQPDRAFHSYMAQWMDKPTEGALGGSLWHYFQVSVDWQTGRGVALPYRRVDKRWWAGR